jgi:hypothetical protein
MDEAALDGNVAAGMLSEIFARDVTVVVTSCAGCGTDQPVAQLSAYLNAPGLVLRCVACGLSQIRLVRAPDRAWLSFSGVRSLQFDLPSDGGKV